MKRLLSLKDLTRKDVFRAGGKGASLGELIQAKLPVPPGFVVLTDAFQEFLEKTDLNVEIDSILHTVNTDAVHTVERASEQIQTLILNANIPLDIQKDILEGFSNLNAKFVAVRSSATSEDSLEAAWAGQLDTFLNVKEENLLENVQRCWASLFTPRAIFYRFEKNLDNKQISVAVVVQKMIQSEQSGIAFSVHPVTEDRNQLIIEAGLGLGEAIVSGAITPDSYVVEKVPRRVIDINVNTQFKALYQNKAGENEWRDLKSFGEKQVLTEDQVLELSELILKIEKHYNSPQDIEWAREEEIFYITQSRPITTLGKITKNTNTQYKPQDYIRMFSGKGLGFLNSDIFIRYYKELGVLSMQDETAWMSFLPKKSQEQTLKKGAILYTDKKVYQKYVKEFSEFRENSNKYFNKILDKKLPTTKDLEKFFELTSELFSFYSKTEFFYTDRIDQDKMVPSIHEFDQLKLGGREFLNKMIFEDDGYVKSLLAKLSKIFNVPEEELANYRIKEILDLSSGENPLSSKTIKERFNFFDANPVQFFGEESKKYSSKLFSSYRELSNVIHGTTAYGGFVTAKARILLPDWQDFSKIIETIEEMEEGEVIIAETTSPELLPAIKKASAIITNQGGMLSHAAIVSRELKIPCVIGTDKDVTINIKTGDQLEIDADNGIIKILK